MASVIIHMAVGKCIGDLVGKNSKAYFLGTIAPDANKFVGRRRAESHFEDDTSQGVPNIKKFLEKYRSYLEEDFVFGYLIHLYTDKYWEERFLPSLKGEDHVKLLDGSIIPLKSEEVSSFLYQDYMKVNISTIEDHELDLSLFYDEVSFPLVRIEEVTHDFRTFLDEMGVCIENSKSLRQHFFDQEMINLFIEECSLYILKELKKNDIMIRT